jgi:glycyl-tRNA synthetase beta chain
MAELLLELFSEEIPARMQNRAAQDLAAMVADGLAKHGLRFAAPVAFVTPRRLTLIIEDLPAATPDVREERRGPRVGAPEAALEGFLKGAGVRLDQCEQRDTGKGVFYFALIARAGRPTAEVAREVIEAALANFPWPKSMRWGSGSVRWVRPLQSILCLLDGALLPVTFGELTAGRSTCGHRFLAPDRFEVTDAADYRAKLAAAKVMLDGEERRQFILAAAHQAAAAEGLALKDDDGLLAEVSGLVEWPAALIGSFDADFMEVPPEALITSMRSHQKYFSLSNPDGSLANRFLLVANMPDRSGAILAGNQRVLRARLSDAKFFWQQDRLQPLASRIETLNQRVFYAGLGTIGDKAKRLEKLATLLSADPAAARAGLLAKADLSTEMVGEFPELQGIMGRYYALADGEPAAVCEAIGSHYAPQGPSDSCPTEEVSVAVALADKIDTLLPLFIEAHSHYGSLPGKADATAVTLLDFIVDRLKVYLRDQGVRHDLISAVAGNTDDLLELVDKIGALAEFLDQDDGANLLIAYRRAANIVRIEKFADPMRVDFGAAAGLPEEVALHQAWERAKIETATPDFADKMTAMAALRAPMDAFFDKVTVNSADPAERLRRLTLLSDVRALMDEFADFDAIEG